MKLLIIGFVWPEPDSSAAGSRMMQLIDAFKSKEYQITFASSAAASEYAVDLPEYGISTEAIEINNAAFNEFIKRLKPDIVLFDRFMSEEQFGWRVAEHCPNTLRVLDTEDLHSLRKTRQECTKANEEFTINKWLQADITKREIASIYRCDLTLIISRQEMALLGETLQIDRSLLYYLPFMLTKITGDDIKELPLFKERQHFMTIGSFRHAPNLDSVRYLKDQIWPKIRKKLPTAEMHVYGSYPIQKAMQLHNVNDGFLIKGWVKDSNEVMQKYRVCLAPLRFGAGLKGKFVHAMRNGIPSVTTTIGAEGLSDSFGGFIADAAPEIAEKAITLYTNQDIWMEKQGEGFESINSQFIAEEFIEDFFNTIETILSELPDRRLQNFIGRMLTYHGLQSTKYMSKWIEEKNKKQ